MYDQNYEEYMRRVLGYPMGNNSTYPIYTSDYYNRQEPVLYNQSSQISNAQELEECDIFFEESSSLCRFDGNTLQTTHVVSSW